ncbi:MAG: transcription antitermination factor NusB [Solobacterium sp.]|nr:transcription antitermination factor NusB [Solobacterium sp.]
MKRHEQREKAMITVYQYLMMPRNTQELIESVYDMPEDAIEPYFRAVIHDAIGNQEKYAGYLDRVMDNWSYERLGCIEKAILLVGCAEFNQKKTEAAVIIDEAVRMAKKYCGEDSYKFINRVLDVI